MPLPPPSLATIEIAGTTPMRARLARPSGRGPFDAVVVAHDLYGVDDDLEQVLRELAEEGHLAVAPELYHRTSDPGTTFTADERGRADAFAELVRVTRDGVVADVAATIAHLGTRPDTTGEVALLGFGAGGHAAVVAASALPLRTVVAVQPAWLGTTTVPLSRPEPTITLAPAVTGRLAIVAGGADRVVTPTELALVERTLRGAGVDHDLTVLPGAGHGFFWPGSPTHDAGARAEAWEIVLRELKR